MDRHQARFYIMEKFDLDIKEFNKEIGIILVDSRLQLCMCDCGTTCPLGKVGMEERCTLRELKAAKIPLEIYVIPM